MNEMKKEAVRPNHGIGHLTTYKIKFCMDAAVVILLSIYSGEASPKTLVLQHFGHLQFQHLQQ